MGQISILNLDAYTSASPLTLINAPPVHLIGTFGSVTFLGSRTATVNYDVCKRRRVSQQLPHSAPELAQGAGEFRSAGAFELLILLALGLLLLHFAAEANDGRPVAGDISGKSQSVAQAHDRQLHRRATCRAAYASRDGVAVRCWHLPCACAAR